VPFPALAAAAAAALGSLRMFDDPLTAELQAWLGAVGALVAAAAGLVCIRVAPRRPFWQHCAFCLVAGAVTSLYRAFAKFDEVNVD
jgi:hypothetical protein